MEEIIKKATEKKLQEIRASFEKESGYFAIGTYPKFAGDPNPEKSPTVEYTKWLECKVGLIKEAIEPLSNKLLIESSQLLTLCALLDKSGKCTELSNKIDCFLTPIKK